jgi:hypothetical protein
VQSSQRTVEIPHYPRFNVAPTILAAHRFAGHFGDAGQPHETFE